MTDDLDRWLVVGLGNPGDRYSGTRHNVGFAVVDAIADTHSIRLKPSKRFAGDLGLGKVNSHAVILLKPQTYMNLSGESVQPLSHYYRIPIERIVVIHDEIDLDLGRLKVKQGGGTAGHKGLRSIAQCLGTNAFVRIRMGVGRPQRGGVASHVLDTFSVDEQSAADDLVLRATQALDALVAFGATETANRFNGQPANT